MAIVTGERNKISVKIGRIVAMVILLLLSVLVLIPLVWTICMSLKPDGEIYNGRFFPTSLEFINYQRSVTKINFFLYLRNTGILLCLSLCLHGKSQ